MEFMPSPEIQYVSEANRHQLGSEEKPINTTSEREDSFSKFNLSSENQGHMISHGNYEGDGSLPLNVDHLQLMPGTISSYGAFGQKNSSLKIDCPQSGHGDEHPNGIHREEVASQLDMPQARLDCEAPNGTHDREGSLPNVRLEHKNIVEEFAIDLHEKEHILIKSEKEKQQVSQLENPVMLLVSDTMNGDEKKVETKQNGKVDAANGRGESLFALYSCSSMNVGPQLVSPNVGHETSDTLGGTSDMQKRDMVSLSDSEEKSDMQPVENGSSSSIVDGGSYGGDLQKIEQDDPLALWVKWRGRWQAGIRCSRIDCPLSTLKAKPTHERKNYVAVFFPHSRTHCWADTSLLRPIYEQPEPLAYGTHYFGKELVKDLNAPRHYVMQKLAIAMLDVIDKLHIEAVIEQARTATAWKEFATEASQCESYSDLGRMLLKLQSMILSNYVSSYWLEHSYGSWACQCQNARDAQSVEILMKELMDSVLWDKISDLWDAPVQPDLGSEWKTCKQEVMKLFSTSHPITTSIEGDFRKSIDAIESTPISRKRQKLEVRRAEVHDPKADPCNSHWPLAQVVGGENYSGEIDYSGFIKNTLVSQKLEEENFVKESLPVGCANKGDHPVAFVVAEVQQADPPAVEDAVAPNSVGTSNLQMIVHKASSGKGDRQCSAFVESKGRQCGRWANVGYIYCAKHLNLLSPDDAVKPKQPSISFSSLLLCSGTTTSGKRCKHRSRDGSGYCLKHKLDDSTEMLHSARPSGSTANKLRRKRRRKRSSIRNVGLETVFGRELILRGGDQNGLHENLRSGLGSGNLYQNMGMADNSDRLASSSTGLKGYSTDIRRCNGWCRKNDDQCLRKAKHNSSYCEKHTPNWLNCEGQFISLEIFNDLVNNARSGKQKAQLYRASELLYEFLKGSLSKGIEQDTSKETFMERIVSEVSGNRSMIENLLKLVSSEHEKLRRIWGFNEEEVNRVKHITSFLDQPVVSVTDEDFQNKPMKRCKFCTDAFSDDQLLGLHWIKSHKKEAQWLFRGYACGICKVSFTNKKVLIAHIEEKHGRQFVEHGILFLCMTCNSHFNSFEQLWLHVIAVHAADLGTTDIQQHKGSVKASAENSVEGFLKLGNTQMLQSDNLKRTSDKYSDNHEYEARRFVCRFCGLKFALLPDLGRHHQAAHMGPNSTAVSPQKKATDLSTFKHLERRGEHGPDFGRSIESGRQTQNYDIDKIAMTSYCLDVTKTLFSVIQRTKPRPSNSEILAIAQAVCCRSNLQATLEAKYGSLPERLYLKAAKLCSELNIPIEWHQDGYICPKGCGPLQDHPFSLMPLPDTFAQSLPLPSDSQITSTDPDDATWEMDESHCVLRIESKDSKHFKPNLPLKSAVICEDLSFGKETIPVPCIVDGFLMDSLHKNSDALHSGGDGPHCSMPWKDFTYITSRLLDPSFGLDTESSQLGCTCPHATCRPDMCDHVYLFNNDCENAVDINGKTMRGRFPYDESGQIVLGEGFLVYECNSRCSCDQTCQNRVLQKGVQVKLEVYKTENKGWAVRAGEAICRGTFVCEYIGEVLDEQNAIKRQRHVSEGCGYLYQIDAHIEENELNEGAVPYVIDATNYGNVARFINHSCSPNLVKYQVLVESMDCQLSHIGFYASRDIDAGDELAYDYRHKSLPGKGCPCYCGAANCRGHLY